MDAYRVSAVSVRSGPVGGVYKNTHISGVQGFPLAISADPDDKKPESQNPRIPKPQAQSPKP